MTSPHSANSVGPNRTNTRWNKAQIRAARSVQLAPLLIKRGMRLQPLAEENFCVIAYDDLLIKESYWRWPSKNIEGNAIDFFVFVEGMSFAEAMTLLAHAH